MKNLIGAVSSNKMTGTVAVTIGRFVAHPLYGKRIRRSQTYLAKTPDLLNIGDSVEIREVRPVSKNVHFEVVRVVTKVEVLPEVKQTAAEGAEEPKPVKKVKVVNKAKETN